MLAEIARFSKFLSNRFVIIYNLKTYKHWVYDQTSSELAKVATFKRLMLTS